MSAAREIKTSRLLSYYLRHAAAERNIPISSEGYVLVDALLAQPDFKAGHVDLALIQQAVANNSKQRFQMKKDSKGDIYIRATQGHSIASVRSEDLLTPITMEDLPRYPVVVHGTFRRFWENNIKENGLSRMGRNHVHFATGYPNDGQVISGMRQACDVYIELDLVNALSDGMKVYVSANGVILTDGFDGLVHPKYFKTVRLL